MQPTTRAIAIGVLGLASASASTAAISPEAGLYRHAGSAVHYVCAGKPIAMNHVALCRVSDQFCRSPQQARAMLDNPLPSCRFELSMLAPGTYRAEVTCPGNGERITATNRFTATTIYLQMTQRGADGVRMSVEHSDRIGDCPAGRSAIEAPSPAR